MKVFSGILIVAMSFFLMQCKQPDGRRPVDTGTGVGSRMGAAQSAVEAAEAADDVDAAATGFTQLLDLSIDGKASTLATTDIVSLNFVNHNMLGLAFMSEGKNLQLAIMASLAELKPGSYPVYDCKGPSQCDQAEDDKNQNVILGPFPADPMPAVSLSRFAYNAPSLGLAPLTLDITSVTDVQQPGVAWPTKRVQGKFSGTLAYTEQVSGGYDYKVVGKTTRLEGRFDLYCGMR